MSRQPQNMQEADSFRLFSANPAARNFDQINPIDLNNIIEDQTRNDRDMNNPESSSKGQIEEESRNLLEIGNDALMHLKNDRNLSAEENAYDEKATQTYVEILERATSIGQENYEAQLLGYQGLGDVYKARGKFVDAIALYNFALGIVNNDEKNQSFIPDQGRYKEELTERIEQAEEWFLKEVHSTLAVSHPRLDEAHRIYLESIRDEARAKLGQQDALTRMIEICISEETDRIEKIQYTTSKLEAHQVSTEQIYRDINERLRGFVRLMVHECQQELQAWQEAPSEEEYAIICFGSLARDEATPYSDLEFGVLLADGTDKDDRKAYFRVLTRLLNIKVLNLGETTPRMQDIGELRALGLCERYSDSPNRAGFSFDGNNPGGRKTPLGNSECDDVDEADQYELIRTVAQMADLHNENWHNKDNHLSTVIRTVKCIQGNAELVNSYNTMVKAYYEMQENGNLLLGQKRSLEYISDSTISFEPKLGLHEETGHHYSAKYDLYRLPQILIDHLALYFNVDELNTWKRINSLLEDVNAARHFQLEKVVLAINHIFRIRLRCYLYSNKRENKLFTIDRTEFESNINDVSEFYQCGKQVLIDIYHMIIPFFYRLRNFSYAKTLDTNNAESNKNVQNLLGNKYFIEGVIYQCLLDYKRARIVFRIAKEELKNNVIAQIIILSKLSDIDVVEGKHPDFLANMKKIKNMSVELPDSDNVLKLKIKAKLADAYFKNWKIDKAISIYEKNKFLERIKNNCDLMDYLTCLHNYANMLRSNGKVQEFRNKMSEIIKLLHENTWSSINYIRFSLLCARVNNEEDQISALMTKTLRLIKTSFGEYHPIAIEYHDDMAKLCIQHEDFEAAYNHVSKGIAIYNHNFRKSENRLLGQLLFSQGIISLDLENCCYHFKAYDFFQRAFYIFESEFGKSTPSLVACLYHMAEIDYKNHEFHRAERLLKDAEICYENNNIETHENKIKVKLLLIKLQIGRATDILELNEIENDIHDVTELLNKIYKDKWPNEHLSLLYFICSELLDTKHKIYHKSEQYDKALDMLEEQRFIINKFQSPAQAKFIENNRNTKILANRITSYQLYCQKIKKSHNTKTKVLKKLKKAYQSNNEDCLRKNFLKLGDIYCTNNNFIDAIAVYNYALSYSKRNPKSVNTVIDKINDAKKRFLLVEGISDYSSNVTDSNELVKADSKVLLKLRSDVKVKLDERESSLSKHSDCSLFEFESANSDLSLKSIYLFCSEKLRQFITNLIGECFNELGNPPCTYAFVALGSLARDEATPYSDLEFMILIEDRNDESSNGESKRYFRLLTKWLQIKIINLGETTPRMQNLEDLHWMIDRYSKSPVINGLCFDGQMDGACKTPLGNRHLFRANIASYELINTPKEMALLHSDSHFRSERNLSSILSCCKLLKGEKKLIDDYNKLSRKLLLCQQSDIEPEFNIQEIRHLIYFRETTAAFEPRIGIQTENGRQLHLKYDLYRILHLSIMHLCNYGSIFENNTLNSLNLLYENNIIGLEGYKTISEKLLYILGMRLKSHLKFNSQVSITFIENEDRTINLPCEPISEDKMIDLYRSIIPFHKAMLRFITEGDINSLQSERFYDESELMKGMIMFKFDDPKSVREAMEVFDKLKTQNSLAYYYLALFYFIKSSQKIRSLEHIKSYLECADQIPVQNFIQILILISSIEIIDADQKNLLKSLYFAHIAFKYAQAFPEHSLVALINLGKIYSKSNKLLSAACTYHAFKSSETLYGINCDTTVDALNDFVLSCHELALYERDLVYAEIAIEYGKKLLKIDINIHGHYHKKTAYVLQNIGLVYSDCYADFNSTLEYYKKAEEILINYGYTPQLAAIYQCMAGTFISLNQPNKAKEYARREKEIASNLGDDTTYNYTFTLEQLCVMEFVAARYNISLELIVRMFNEIEKSFPMQQTKNQALLYIEDNYQEVLSDYKQIQSSYMTPVVKKETEEISDKLSLLNLNTNGNEYRQNMHRLFLLDPSTFFRTYQKNTKKVDNGSELFPT